MEHDPNPSPPLNTDVVLSRYDGASGSIRKKLAIRLVGMSFSRMAFALDEAAQQLRAKAARDLRREEDEKKDEDEDGIGNDCDSRCVSEKMKTAVREMGGSARDSLLKLGLSEHLVPSISLPDPSCRSLTVDDLSLPR